MRNRPNNNKVIGRTKSPIITPSHTLPLQDPKFRDRVPPSKLETIKLGSPDVRARVGSPEVPRESKKIVEKSTGVKQVKSTTKEELTRGVKMEGNRKIQKQQDDNTTQQSSSQHLSYVTGEYQLDSYDLFSRRKNVKFTQKIEDLQKTDKGRGSSNTSRNSSILKNSSRILDRSLASSQKSISIQNSFTAVKKCKIGLAPSHQTGNALIKKKYQAIVDQMKSSRERGIGKQRYIDELFPPVEASIFSTSVHRRGHLNKNKDEIVWMRLSQIFKCNLVVYSKENRQNLNISRGEKNNAQTYLVTSMNTIKNCPQLLEFMFQKEDVNPYGIYLVKIYQEHTWKYIIIDDLIPCTRKRNKGKHEELYTPFFLNTVVSEGHPLSIWPFLLQKAYANYYNSYQNLCHGNPIDFLSQLSGTPFKQITLLNKKMNKATIEKNLISISTFFSHENVMALGWSDQKNQFYPVYLLKENYTGEEIQLGLGDPLNNYNPIKVELAQLPQLLSTIYIYWYKQYEKSTSCPVYPPKIVKDRQKPQKQKKVRHIEIPPNDTISLRTFTIFKKTKCCLNLKQKQSRFYWQSGLSQYLWVRCLFLQKEYDGGYRWIAGRYCNQKHIIFQEHLQPGEYIMVIMTQWRQRHNKQLTALLYSDCQFLKFQRKNYNRDDKIIQLACMDLAQSLGKLNQINKSICAYTFLCQDSALIIENIINQRMKGQVTILRSINGLKSKVQILPINRQFQIDAPQEYGSIQKEGKRVIGQSVQIDIQKGQSFTVVLRMRGGVDKKFYRVFNFG